MRKGTIGRGISYFGINKSPSSFTNKVMSLFNTPAFFVTEGDGAGADVILEAAGLNLGKESPGVLPHIL